ncbi:MAG: uncharacterized membrane protein YhaH (DUF805 family) [Saprospiraceae bacterium]|jgi:uncharacterized membrane protein YhaH (DUF805 family)
MDMFDYYKKAFSNYAEYKGRATQAEYWYFVLCHFLVSASLIILIVVGAENYNDIMSGGAGIALGLYTLASIIPSFMASVRRLHDTGKSGWFTMFGFIPVVGGLLLTILLAQKSDGDNEWGESLDLEDLPIERERLALPVIEFDDDYV